MTLNWQQLFLAERIPLFERISASLVSFLLPGTTAAGLVEFRTLNRKIFKCKPNSSEASIIILHAFAVILPIIWSHAFAVIFSKEFISF
ncbi:hypothetical protein [Anaerocolumna jejuensis]|uniref:hypothetical protein n=1 Tax=Anaerocolumna jejuensis TaxID=259063 RepID=UPI001114D3E5|nr:hypothetical protein [Anaerocolumna jejuensis]